MDPEEGSTKTAGDSGYTSAGADQAESYANDPKNHIDDLKDKADSKSDKGTSNTDLRSKLMNRKTAIGGGLAGIIVAIIFAVISLLPLKIEALMKNIFQKRIGDKIEHMEEKRADKMVVAFLIKNAGGSTDAGVVRDTSLLGGVIKTWRLNKFGDKFTTKSGISIKPSADGKGITLSTGEGGIKKDFKNAAEFEKFINGGSEGTLKGLDARKFIRTVTRSETYWFQIYKRSNMRKFMRSAYGIHKWSWFTGKEGDAATTELSDEASAAAAARLEEDIPKVVDCATGDGTCPADNNDRTAPEGDHTPGTTAPDLGGTPDDLKGGIRDSLKTARETAKKLSPKALLEKGLTKILSGVLEKQLAEKISSKSIAGVGLVLIVDQISRVDHFFSTGDADTALRAIHKLQYATLYAQWAVIADNFKDPNHKMSGDEVNATMTKLEGMENSAAFNDIFLQTAKGDKIKPSLGVSDKQGVTPIKNNYNQYADTLGAPLTAPLRAWYRTSHLLGLNKLIDAFNLAIGDAFSAVLNLIPGANNILQGIGQFLSGMILKLVEPAVSGFEVGSPLVNGIDAGGAVTGLDFAGSLGAHKMTLAQTQEQSQVIAFDKGQSAPGLYDRLFSKDYASSFVNQLAVMTPSTPVAAVGQVSSYSLAIVQNPFHIFNLLLSVITGKAHAGAPIDLYGLQDYSFTEAELDQPITDIDDRNHDGKIDAQDCQTNPDGTAFTPEQKTAFNNKSQGQMCLLDVAVAQDVTSVYTKSDDGGLGDSNSNPSPANGQTGSTSSGNTNVSGLAWPLPIAGSNVTSCYGYRAFDGRIHPGDDISQPSGTPVYATKDGTVAFEGPTSGYGSNFIIIDHSGGTYTSYGHMNSAIVTKGQVVKQGQQIGTVGNEGASSGPHLHFNLYLGGTSYADGYNGNVEPLTHGLTLPAGVPVSGTNCSAVK